MASGTSHFYSFVFVNILERPDFLYDNLGLKNVNLAKYLGNIFPLKIGNPFLDIGKQCGSS